MLNKVRIKVYGKLNLSLNITGTQNGLHTLDSVVTSVSLADVITVRDRYDDKINLIFNADFVPEDNSVVKAVNALRRSFGPFGADIVVDKHLPFSGGMGGSSADAAGVIAALVRLFDFDKRGLNIDRVCSEVGSDVKYMLSGGFARMKGVGEIIDKLDINTEIGFVCVKGGGTLTSKVYAEFDRVGTGGGVDNDALIMSLKSGKVPKLGNMLTRAAIGLCHDISRNMDALVSLDLTPNMTGSGSTVYAISSDPERDAARLKERGFDAFSVFSLSSGIQFE